MSAKIVGVNWNIVEALEREISMSLEIEVMLPLYPPDGAPVRGYVCTNCKRVTKTKTGMWTHLRTIHGIKRQPRLAFPGKVENAQVNA